MSFDQALIAARYRRDDEDALSDLAQAALAEGQEESALPVLHGAAQRLDSALLWQWTGLLHRALDEHEAALAAFAEAAALAPTDKSIAHGRARVALESGLPAESPLPARPAAVAERRRCPARLRRGAVRRRTAGGRRSDSRQCAGALAAVDGGAYETRPASLANGEQGSGDGVAGARDPATSWPGAALGRPVSAACPSGAV